MQTYDILTARPATLRIYSLCQVNANTVRRGGGEAGRRGGGEAGRRGGGEAGSGQDKGGRQKKKDCPK